MEVPAIPATQKAEAELLEPGGQGEEGTREVMTEKESISKKKKKKKSHPTRHTIRGFR